MRDPECFAAATFSFVRDFVVVHVRQISERLPAERAVVTGGEGSEFEETREAMHLKSRMHVYKKITREWE